METRDDMEFLCLWTSPSNMNDEKNLCDACAAEQDKSLWNQHWNALQLDGFLVFVQVKQKVGEHGGQQSQYQNMDLATKSKCLRKVFGKRRN